MNNQPINMMDILADPQGFENQVNQFAADNLQGVNPEQKVRELVNSGQMSQEQYNRFSKIAMTMMKFMGKRN